MATFPSVLRGWAMDPTDLTILASLLYKMMDTDIHLGTDFPDWVGLCPMDVTERKTVWIGEWENRVRAGLVALLSDSQPKMFFDTMPEFEASLAALRTPGNRFRAGILLIELAASEGYWPEVTGDDYLKGVYISPEIRAQTLSYICGHLGFPTTYGMLLREGLEERLRLLAKRTGLVEPREFAGWRLNWLTHGISTPFWRGGLRGSLGEGGIQVSSGKDLIPWAISHLASAIIMSENVRVPGSNMPLGAGGGLLLAPGMTHALPDLVHLQPETFICAAAKFQLSMSEVMVRLGVETVARREIVELLCRSRDCYSQGIRSGKIVAGTADILACVEAVFDELIETTKNDADL